MYTRTIHTHDLRFRTLDIQHTRDHAHITKTYHMGKARPCTLDIQLTRTHDLGSRTIQHTRTHTPHAHITTHTKQLKTDRMRESTEVSPNLRNE